MPADFSSVGVAVGHSTDADGATGLTVIRGVDGPLRGGVAVFGRATGTRELHTLAPEHVAGRVDAILLSGGSAYGLDAAAGVMRWMEEQGRGFPVEGGVVPIVPAAVIIDLAPLGKFDARPTAGMAYAATQLASATGIAEGSVGAGTGATVGNIAGPRQAMKGGFGAAMVASGETTIAALACVNALGDVRDASGRIIAGARDGRGGFLDTASVIAAGVGTRPVMESPVLRNTTLAVVVSSVPIGRTELGQLARAAGAALFRRITPAGTTFDGDVVFALSPVDPPPATALGPGRMAQLEALAVRALEEAIERGVRLARGRDGIPGLGDAT